MTRDEAAQILELLTGERRDAAAIRRAWAAAIKANHPDTGTMHVNCFRFSIEKLTKARDFLLQGAEEQNNACKVCGGRGKVRGRWGEHTCHVCKGAKL